MEIKRALFGRLPYYLVWWPPTLLSSALHSSSYANCQPPVDEDCFDAADRSSWNVVRYSDPIEWVLLRDFLRATRKDAPANTPTPHPEALVEPQLDPYLLKQGGDGFEGPPLASGTSKSSSTERIIRGDVLESKILVQALVEAVYEA